MQAFGAAIKACETAGTSFFTGLFVKTYSRKSNTFSQGGEARNKAAIPALAGALEALLPKVDKVLGMCQTNEQFAVGDTMTFADIYIFAIRTFTEDPLLNMYTEIKKAMPPKAGKIADYVAKHPVVAEYIKTDGHVPATGIFDI